MRLQHLSQKAGTQLSRNGLVAVLARRQPQESQENKMSRKCMARIGECHLGHVCLVPGGLPEEEIMGRALKMLATSLLFRRTLMPRVCKIRGHYQGKVVLHLFSKSPGLHGMASRQVNGR